MSSITPTSNKKNEESFTSAAHNITEGKTAQVFRSRTDTQNPNITTSKKLKRVSHSSNEEETKIHFEEILIIFLTLAFFRR